VTHLHRDHADAAALAAALAPDAVVLRPEAGAGDQVADGALRQAEIELARAKLALRECPPWESVQVGPFRVTALPAVDGLGDPQLSWLVAAEEQSVLHCGDTIFHGFWWRVALAYGPIDVAFLPINGSLVGFPHRTPASPYPVVMTPEQAATAGRLLGARNVVPMHYGAYSFPGVYEPVADAPSRFVAAAAGEDYTTRLLDVGEWYELAT
jgi:L-ascorbate metabolism protein UlaG (beta-lactamase superfamily)